MFATAMMEETIDTTTAAENEAEAAVCTPHGGLVWYIEVQSPIGFLVVTSEWDAITGLYMESHRHGPVNRGSWILDAHEEREALRLARAQLQEYFAGARQLFSLPLAAQGSAVQKDVWRALTQIPYGETRSYGEIARQLGKPKASRSVGSANGRNPISIIVPCHRVIGSDGSLTGFGGGLERKEWLLAHESRVSGKPSRFERRDLFSPL
ncbi:MAG: methylated-DNA--[protein]-cysteine S-methyltransferase [Gemmatimonas sp.]